MTDDLTQINNVGPETAENLRAAGFETCAEVRDASVEELTDVELIGEDIAKSIVHDDARHGRGAPTVDEHIDDIVAHARKPISDRGVIRLSDIGWSTHQEWMDKDIEPFATYQERYANARAESEFELTKKGLEGDYDSSLVKFLLKATHDYDDKQTVEHEGDGLGDVHVSFTDDN